MPLRGLIDLSPPESTLDAPPELAVSWAWATVTVVDPLRVRLDNAKAELPITPEDLTGGGHVVGDRVWVMRHGRRRLVTGRSSATDQFDIVLPLTDTTNFEVYAPGQDPVLTRRGQVMQLVGALRLLTAGFIDGYSAGGRVFTQIPVDYAPRGYDAPVVCPASASNRWVLLVATSGVVTAQRHGPGSGGAGTWLPMHVTWLL